MTKLAVWSRTCITTLISHIQPNINNSSAADYVGPLNPPALSLTINPQRNKFQNPIKDARQLSKATGSRVLQNGSQPAGNHPNSHV